MPEDNEQHYRIKNWMKWSMLGVAATIDLIELILGLLGIGEAGVDSAISVGADALFVMWFWILGITFAKKPDRLAAIGIQALIGLIPAVDAVLPELTIAVWFTIRSARKEDEDAIINQATGSQKQFQEAGANRPRRNLGISRKAT